MKKQNLANLAAFKRSREKDLRDFVNVLSKYSSSFPNIAFKDNLKDDLWGYEIDNFSIDIELSTLKHIRPEGFTKAELSIYINVESHAYEWDELNDPFTQLNFEAIIKGTNPKTQNMHYLGFHIDRHDLTRVSNEIHPLYHLHYLQNPDIKPQNEFMHGDSMQLDVPRLIHFPMELILGTSYLLSNFAPSVYDRLLNDRQYINLCKTYQEKIWKPYINSISEFWTTPSLNWAWNPKENCPYLV